MGDNCEVYAADLAWTFGDNILGPCSGNGECLAGIVCKCEDGYTGLSDWVNADGFDCQINIVVFQIEWAVLLLLQLACLVAAVPYLKTRYATYQTLKASKLKRGEPYNILKNRGALAVFSWHIVGVPVILTLCIVKMALLDERIGVTPLVSVLYAMVRIAFYFSLTMFQPSLLEAVVHGTGGDTNKIVVWNRHITYWIFGMQFMAAFLPFVSLADPEAQVPVYLITTFVHFTTGMWLGIQGFYVSKKMNKALDQSYSLAKEERTLVMKRKLEELQKVAIKQGPGAALVVYLPMFLWPFLYVLLLLLLAPLPIASNPDGNIAQVDQNGLHLPSHVDHVRRCRSQAGQDVVVCQGHAQAGFHVGVARPEQRRLGRRLGRRVGCRRPVQRGHARRHVQPRTQVLHHAKRRWDHIFRLTFPLQVHPHHPSLSSTLLSSFLLPL